MKYIRTLLTLVALLFCAVFPNVAQNLTEPPFLVERFEYGGASSDSLWEYGFNISGIMDKAPSSRLIIRLCTKRSMAEAIPTAAVKPLSLARFLALTKGKASIPSNRIFVDRSENCQTVSEIVTVTELWIVDGTTVLPDSKEEIGVSRIQVQEFVSRSDSKKTARIGTACFKKGLAQLRSHLEANPNAVAVVLGNFVEKPNQILNERLLHAAKYFGDLNGGKNRYFVHSNRWTGFSEIEEPGTLSLYLIRILDKEKPIGTEDDIFWYD